jgi:hypothetical protein
MKEAARSKGLKDFYDFFTARSTTSRRWRRPTRKPRANRCATAAAAGQDEIDRLKLELKLIGATNEAARGRAGDAAEEAAAARFDADAATAEADRPGRRDRAQTERNKVAQDEAYNKLLTQQLDILDALDQRARIVADSLADAFGRPARRSASCSPTSPAMPPSASGSRSCA